MTEKVCRQDVRKALILFLFVLAPDLWDEADSLLSMRKAAFHNFMAADHLAQKEGYSAEQEAQLRVVWNQNVSLDAELTAAMAEARNKMEAEIIRLSKVKATIGRFRSGQVTVDDLPVGGGSESLGSSWAGHVRFFAGPFLRALHHKVSPSEIGSKHAVKSGEVKPGQKINEGITPASLSTTVNFVAR